MPTHHYGFFYFKERKKITVSTKNPRVVSREVKIKYLVKVTVRGGSSKRDRMNIYFTPDVIHEARIQKGDRIGYEINYDEKTGNTLSVKIFVTNSRNSYALSTYPSSGSNWQTTFSIPWELKDYIKPGDIFVADVLENTKIGEFEAELVKVTKKTNNLFGY